MAAVWKVGEAGFEAEAVGGAGEGWCWLGAAGEGWSVTDSASETFGCEGSYGAAWIGSFASGSAGGS